MGEGDTLVVVTVAALAFGLLKLIFFPPLLVLLISSAHGLSILEAKGQKNTHQ